MYVCIYICMCVCVCVYVHKHVYMYTGLSSNIASMIVAESPHTWWSGPSPAFQVLDLGLSMHLKPAV